MRKRWWIGGLLIALALTLLSPLASSWPDGLERVAVDLDFMERGQEPPYKVMPDYLLPGIANEGLATVLAGIVGTLMVFGLAYGLARAIRRREPTS